ncbi:Enzyme that catalyzes the fourth step in the histidine pathway [Thoreauomyces humboldtii]|nr:Enzyme that catalyzes the fourth step in the histidine pathway [Thoreauomyces humboldtii]
MTIFRPCIDLHEGQVKQIVGASLSSTDTSSKLRTNFVAVLPPSHYAETYREHDLRGAHVIKLGAGNDDAAREALAAWPKGLQVGGGITIDNAQMWLDAGADKVIVTSWLFPDAKFSLSRLERLSAAIGKESLVVDVSCKRVAARWVVAMDKWQTLTDTEVDEETLALVAGHCSEFLVHAADVEGLCAGVDEELVQRLGEWCSIPCTYAGGGKELADLKLVERLSHGKVDLTFGSALDMFGGSGVKFAECVEWNKKQGRSTRTIPAS